ncbi:hypothetical protein BJX96DRAFT_163304 [Aspergillus floccosus]
MSSFVTDWAQSGLSGALKDNVVDKAINNAVVREAAALGKLLTDFKELKKILNGEQKYKLRRLLNHFLSPSVRPKFIREFPKQIIDKDLIHGLPASHEVQTPFRMIDIDTKNMVDTFPLGPDDQYCIVSHSWKGNEIDYTYFMKAKALDAEHLMASEKVEHNDIDLVVALCDKDLREAEEKVLAFLSDFQVDSIEELLKRFLKVKAVQRDLASAEAGVKRATAHRKKVEREAVYYANLVRDFQNTGDVKKISDKAKVKAHNEEKNAHAKERQCREARSDQDDWIKRFDQRRRESYIIEDLLCALQRNKSLRKILNSIKRTKELFDSRPFPRKGKKYVWLDTCCINKANVNEYTVSMPLMGDWYTNADLCLVHLDTKRSDEEWVKEWKYWKEKQETLLERNVEQYDDITKVYDTTTDEHGEIVKNKVEWATRGWTLQELVLSKTTFYVNSAFEPLDRDIDRIGPYYHFCRFIRPYYKHSTCPDFDKDVLKRNLGELRQGNKDYASRVQNASRIIHLLEEIGFTAPKHIVDLTAKALIEDAVTTAAEATAADNESSPLVKRDEDQKFLDILCKGLVDLTPPKDKIKRKEVLDLLLRALAIETKPVIRKDRDYISDFGQVDSLGGWKKDISSDKFSAHSVIKTASDRNTTVPVDQVYSLMGILGVRFPVFSAEGVPKALARLLDEVVITSNDVSVFNWAGRHSGSSVQGRSLYPSNIRAFEVDPSPMNEAVMNTIRKEHLHKSEVNGRVNKMLIGAFDTVKQLDKKCEILPSLKILIGILQNEKFSSIQPRLEQLEDVMREISDAVKQEIEDRRKAKEQEEKKKAEERKQETMKEQGKADEGDQQGKEEASNTGLFKRKPFKTPSFKLPDTDIKLSKVASAFSRGRDDEPSPSQKSSMDKSPEAGQKEIEVNKWKEVTGKLNHIVKTFSEVSQKNDAPSSFTTGEKESPRTDSPKEVTKDKPFEAEQETKMICPNPIAVTSAGIRGVFDIQRVVVTMQDVDALKTNVANAMSGQYIDGWCTISTGFANTLVAFSCERDVLKQQLDIVHLVNREISGEEESPNEKSSPAGNASSEGQTLCREETSSQGGTQSDNPSDNKEDDPRHITPAQKKLGRMLQFVQESDLHAIAGEWVLARFSSVEGAKWFLCRLELGSGNDFYARRISTDAFTFVNAIPEPGLIRYWDLFMWNKKALACWMLSLTLDSMMSNKSAMDTLKKIDAIREQGVAQKTDKSTEAKEGDAKSADHHDLTPQEVGIMLKNFFMGEAKGQWADHMASKIEVDAMGKIPVRIQGAIADLDKGQSLLPSMFHSGRDIHMF